MSDAARKLIAEARRMATTPSTGPFDLSEVVLAIADLAEKQLTVVEAAREVIRYERAPSGGKRLDDHLAGWDLRLFGLRAALKALEESQ